VKLALCTLAVALAISVVTDLRRRVIWNAVTLPAALAIVALYGWAGGLVQVTDSLLGIAICGVPFFLAALPGWMGMGDAKLMAVVGAAVGSRMSLLVLLAIAIAGGAQAVLWLAAAKLRGQERPRHVPYAVAIAAGTAAAFLLGGAVV
jgi:Flp pilus assembly protein protease CpaA